MQSHGVCTAHQVPSRVDHRYHLALFAFLTFPTCLALEVVVTAGLAWLSRSTAIGAQSLLAHPATIFCLFANSHRWLLHVKGSEDPLDASKIALLEIKVFAYTPLRA